MALTALGQLSKGTTLRATVRSTPPQCHSSNLSPTHLEEHPVWFFCPWYQGGISRYQPTKASAAVWWRVTAYFSIRRGSSLGTHRL
jgi:hypothetical protein